jgi:hypothetical protein
MGRTFILLIVIFFLSTSYAQSSKVVKGDCISVQAIYKKEDKVGQYSLWIKTEKKLECLDSILNSKNSELANEQSMYYNFNAIDDIKIFVNGELIIAKSYLFEKSVMEYPIVDKQGVFFEYKDKIKSIEVIYLDKFLEIRPINLKLL